MILSASQSPPGWLIPEDNTAGRDARVRMLACGGTWDALRTPGAVGLPVVAKLLLRPTDRAVLGPVLHDEQTGTVYWLVSPGHSANWPNNCTLLGKRDWLAVPNPINPHSKLTWLHMPTEEVFTGPPWLAKALQEHLATTDLRTS
jgi:hypothetical protein